eukprot:TRINITY_DN21471_c0_g1_i1.p1 TRINITY_DN21471_c0_g1~~TRINITY_DN21471_c0_g1_i1.p1  ORF type:complete len:744 (+),score=74.06 TRINITY_DN21471_c0_g1_i1:149-2233(+)
MVVTAVQALVVGADEVCKEDTGGTCYFYSCNAWRHAYCSSGLSKHCLCPSGTCSTSKGYCRVEVLSRSCGPADTKWSITHSHMKNVAFRKGCTFFKSSGSANGFDASAVTDRDNVQSITIRATGNMGGRMIGLTTNHGDTSDFISGYYLSLDRAGHAITFDRSVTYKPGDVFSVSLEGSVVHVYKGFDRFATLQVRRNGPLPRSMYAMIWLENVNDEVTIEDVKVVQDCVWNKWQPWSACSVTCGVGTKTRKRAVKIQAQNGGHPCSQVAQESKCRQGPENCPIDCVLGDWGSWGQCSTTCGGGHSSRDRPVTTPAAFGGACPSLRDEGRPCSLYPCAAVDCEFAEWSSWSACSAKCGGGVRTRSRVIGRKAENGGRVCEGESMSVESCNKDPCVSNDCVLGEWGSWSSCSKSCGGGFSERARKVLVPAVAMGAQCGGPLGELRECSDERCSDGLVEWQLHGPIELHDLEFIKTSGSDGVFDAWAQTAQSTVVSFSTRTSANALLKFGLTAKADDDESFSAGAWAQVADGQLSFEGGNGTVVSVTSEPLTVSVIGGFFILYKGSTEIHRWERSGADSAKPSFFAKLYLGSLGSKVWIPQVLTTSSASLELTASALMADVVLASASINVSASMDVSRGDISTPHVGSDARVVATGACIISAAFVAIALVSRSIRVRSAFEGSRSPPLLGGESRQH